MKITVTCYGRKMKYEAADGMTIDDCIETFKLLMSFFLKQELDELQKYYDAEQQGSIDAMNKIDKLESQLIAITDERDARDMRIKELEAELDNAKRLALMSPRKVCEKYQFQQCGICEDINCGDNTSDAKKKITELEAELAKYVKFLKDNGITQDQCGEFECNDCEIYWKNSVREVKQGWIYPCWKVFTWSKDNELKLGDAYAVPYKTISALYFTYDSCICGKDCQPIEVKITVEEI